MSIMLLSYRYAVLTMGESSGRDFQNIINSKRYILPHEKMLNITIREMQIKTIMRYHLTPVRMAIIKKSSSSKYCRGCGEMGTLLHCWWEC